MSVCNLIIIINPRLLDYLDFEEIGRIVITRNPDIRFSLLSIDDDIANFPTVDWRLQSFTVSLSPEVRSLPKRGTVFYCRRIDKLQQIEIMRRARINVPRSEPYLIERRYEEEVWGNFIVVKLLGAEGASKGETTFLVPTRLLKTPEKIKEPVRTLLLDNRAAIEEFIPTGSHPSFYRACTFLGQVLYLQKKISPIELPKLDPNSDEIINVDGNFENPAQNLYGKRELPIDPDVVEFGRRVAKTFPGIPLLGIDILRHDTNNRLYAVETNCGGNTWHFSSPIARRPSYTRDISIEDRKRQFGAWDIAASVLIEKALYYAK